MFLFPAFGACLFQVCFCSLLPERVTVPRFRSVSVPNVFLFPAVRACFCSLITERVSVPCFQSMFLFPEFGTWLFQVCFCSPLLECVFLFPAVGACFCSQLLEAVLSGESIPICIGPAAFWDACTYCPASPTTALWPMWQFHVEEVATSHFQIMAALAAPPLG